MWSCSRKHPQYRNSAQTLNCNIHRRTYNHFSKLTRKEPKDEKSTNRVRLTNVQTVWAYGTAVFSQVTKTITQGPCGSQGAAKSGICSCICMELGLFSAKSSWVITLSTGYLCFYSTGGLYKPCYITNTWSIQVFSAVKLPDQLQKGATTEWNLFIVHNLNFFPVQNILEIISYRSLYHGSAFY